MRMERDSNAPGPVNEGGGLPSSTTGLEDAAAPAAGAPPDAGRSSFFALFSAVMLPMFMGAVDQTLLATATPRIAAELGGLSDTSWVIVGYLLAATLMAPVYGRMGDRFGRRNVMLGALAVFMTGSLACALAPSMPVLIASRVLQGLGGGGLMVLSQALIGELVPPWERPRYQGYFAIVFTSSSVLGPLLGGLVVSSGDWRWLFLANLPLGLIATWRVARLPRPQPSPLRHAPYDPAGLLLFVLCACSALLWLGQVGQRIPLLSAASGLLLGLAAATGALLWFQQRRHSHAFLPLDILRLDGVPWLCLSVIAFAGCLFAMVFLLPIFLHVVHGTSAVGSGLQLLPLTVGIVVGSTLNSRVTLRLQRTGVLPPWGLAAAAAGLGVLALLPRSHAVITAAVAACGIGLGTVMPNAQLATQMLAGRTRLGTAAALLALVRSLGASVGTAAFGGLLFTLLRPPQGAGLRQALSLERMDPQQVASAFRIVFLTVAAYALCGAAAAWRAPRVPLREQARG